MLFIEMKPTISPSLYALLYSGLGIAAERISTDSGRPDRGTHTGGQERSWYAANWFLVWRTFGLVGATRSSLLLADEPEPGLVAAASLPSSSWWAGMRLLVMGLEGFAGPVQLVSAEQIARIRQQPIGHLANLRGEGLPVVLKVLRGLWLRAVTPPVHQKQGQS